MSGLRKMMNQEKGKQVPLGDAPNEKSMKEYKCAHKSGKNKKGY